MSDTPNAPGDVRTWPLTDIAARTKPTIGQNDRSSSREPSTTTGPVGLAAAIPGAHGSVGTPSVFPTERRANHAVVRATCPGLACSHRTIASCAYVAKHLPARSNT